MTRYQDPDWKDQVPPTLIGEGRACPSRLVDAVPARPLRSRRKTTTATACGSTSRCVCRPSPSPMASCGRSCDSSRRCRRRRSHSSPSGWNRSPRPSAAWRGRCFRARGAPCLKCHMTGDAAHDARATAPNFTVAKDRLKPGWTRRWLLDPAMMAPGTAMPSGLFSHEGGPLGVRRSHARELQRVSQGPRRSIGAVHVPVHARRTGPPPRERSRTVAGYRALF